MNPEETVALVAGGHTFGKAHGAGSPELAGFLSPKARTSKKWAWAGKTPTVLEKAMIPPPVVWKGPGSPIQLPGITAILICSLAMNGNSAKAQPVLAQWHAVDVKDEHMIPSGPWYLARRASNDDHCRYEPAYAPRARAYLPCRFGKIPMSLPDAFARAWFKLTHRDMGPKHRYLGPKFRQKIFLAGPNPRLAASQPSAADLAAERENSWPRFFRGRTRHRCLVLRR